MIYKRGKYYSFKFQWHGKMLYFATSQSDARVAKNLEAKKRIELAEERGGIKKKKPVPILRDYLNDRILPWAEAQFTKTPKSLKWYKNESRVLCEFKPLANTPLDEIKDKVVTDFKNWRLKQGKTISTVNSSIRVLRSTLTHALEDELINSVPKLTVLDGANIRNWVLPFESERTYLKNCTEPLKTVAVIMLDAGLRPDECFRLRWENVRWINSESAVLRVPGSKSLAALRAVPMTRRLRDMIKARWVVANKPTDGWVFPAQRASVGRIVPNTVYEPHRNAVRASKLSEKQFVLYALRHTCLTRWGTSGMDAWTLAHLAGHSNVNQSMTYVHPSEKSLHAAIDHMSASDEIRDIEQNEAETVTA